MKIFFLILSILFAFLSPAHADMKPIFVVQSSQLKPYEEAMQGLRTTLAGIKRQRGLKSIQPYPVKEIILEKKWGARQVQKVVETQEPALIIAVGTNALDASRQFKNIPIIYVMVPFPDSLVNGKKNVTGIDMQIDPEVHFDTIIHTLPSTGRLGLIYDPQRTGPMVEAVKKIAERKSVTLIAREAATSTDVPLLLESMAAEIDVFWMLPDLTVVTPDTTEQILIYSLEHRIPVVTFSQKYLKLGATLAVTFDIESMGRQAGEIAKKIISGTRISRLPSRRAEQTRVYTNRKVAKKLNIEVSDHEH